MNTKFRNLFLPLMAGAIAFSCEKNEMDEISPEATLSTEMTSNASSNNLLFNETFEGSSIFSGLHRQFGTSHAFNIAGSPVASGSKSGRFELRDSDPNQSGGTRSEVLFPEQSGLNLWYGFSVYHPAADYAKDSYTEIINQWHQGGGTSPAIAIEIQNDRYQLVMPGSATATGTRERIDLGPVTKDKWNQFALHINHSSGSDGLIEVWISGKKVLNRTGKNMYPLSSFSKPRWKVGIYKWKWNGDLTTDTKKRVLYFDDIKLGDQNATLANMTGGTTTSTTTTTTTEPTPTITEPTPTTTEPTTTGTTTSTSGGIQSFTLVNASQDVDVMNFADGATLNLSAIGVYKFNVRANTASSVSTVKFELSGTQSRTYSDTKAPFAVQGDDGNRNYYFGKWTLPTAAGSYTLKATPYVDGKAGAPTTIRFTVK